MVDSDQSRRKRKWDEPGSGSGIEDPSLAAQMAAKKLNQMLQSQGVNVGKVSYKS